MRDLVSCPACRRLHRLREVQCPFCRFARVVVFAAVLPLAVACHTQPKEEPAPTTTASTLVASAAVASAPVASTAPTMSALADPSAMAALTPSAVASIQQAAIGRDAGGVEVDASAPTGLAGVGTLVTGIGMYGAPPPPTPRSTTVVTVVASGAKSPEDDRVVAQLRPRLRYCYERGLAVDPSMKGKLVLGVSIAADGSATATKKSGSGLSNDIESCMLAGTQRAAFAAAPAHAIELTVTASNPK